MENNNENINKNILKDSFNITDDSLNNNNDSYSINKKFSSYKNNDYTFDGIYFENIEKIGDFKQIIKLKNATKQGNEEESKECLTNLKNKNPQLFEFILKHGESFKNFFELDNNALLTLKL